MSFPPCGNDFCDQWYWYGTFHNRSSWLCQTCSSPCCVRLFRLRQNAGSFKCSCSIFCNYRTVSDDGRLYPFSYESLEFYIPLIVVNCIILGRAESYASKNSPSFRSFDDLEMGLGFYSGPGCHWSCKRDLGSGKAFGESTDHSG